MGTVSDDSYLEFNAIDNNSKTLCIYHQNIRSLRENFDKFCLYLSSLINRPDIIVLSEIWISELELNNFVLESYNQFANCNEMYRSGGVIVFVSQQYVARASSLAMTAADAIKITLDLDCETSISIVGVYRLHSFPVSVYLDQLVDVLCMSKERNLLYIGDINLCVLEQSQVVDDYQVLMGSYGLAQLIDSPTRGTRCLDHIYFRSRDNILSEAFVLESGRSDHNVLVCNLFINNVLNLKRCTNMGATLKKTDYKLMLNLLSKENWATVYSENNASNAFKQFLYLFTEIIEKSVFDQVKQSGVTFLKPWMTAELCKRQKHRNILYKKLKKTPNNIKLKRYYDSFSLKLKQDLQCQKNNYYTKLFDRNKYNTKKQWSTVNSILGQTNKKNNINSIKKMGNPEDVIFDSLDIANEFNKFFTTVVDGLVANMDPADIVDNNEYSTIFPAIHIQNSFFFLPTCPYEISSVINKLNSNKSPGVDGVSSFAIKTACNFISPVLSYIFNLSFETGVFPDDLKIAVVIPLHKKGDSGDLNTYRPISLLSNFSKILEKLVKSRLVKFLKINNILSLNQYGFVEKKSTEDALLSLLSNVYDGLNSKLNVAGLFIDITKAFDSVDHHILLSRLWEIGVRGVSNMWFRSYLAGRKQCVRVRDSSSSLLPISLGVPQGSVLGPILFIIFINNLCYGRFKGKVNCFADDTAFSYSASESYTLSSYIQSDLDKLKMWFTVNKLVLSIKTKVIYFSLRSKGIVYDRLYFKCKSCFNSPVYTSCDECILIEQVQSIKYLGLIIDTNCNWKEHIKSVKKYLIIALRKFYLLKYICPIEVLRTVYFALVNSKLDYGLSCWGGIYNTTLKPLLMSQKYIIRQIFNLRKRDHSFPFFRILKVLPIRHMYLFKVLRIFYKRGGQQIANEAVYSVRLRNLNQVKLLKPNCEAFKRFYSYCSLKFFNKLPFNVSNANTLGIFSRDLKKWLFSFNNDEIESVFQ